MWEDTNSSTLDVDNDDDSRGTRDSRKSKRKTKRRSSGLKRFFEKAWCGLGTEDNGTSHGNSIDLEERRHKSTECNRLTSLNLMHLKRRNWSEEMAHMCGRNTCLWRTGVPRPELSLWLLQRTPPATVAFGGYRKSSDVKLTRAQSFELNGLQKEELTQINEMYSEIQMGSQYTSFRAALKDEREVKRGNTTAWGRGGRGRGGRGRGGGGGALLGSGAAPATYPPALQDIGPGLREVVNVLGERNQAGTLTGVRPPPGAPESDEPGDEEEGTSPKRPPRPLYKRLLSYVRQAWTGVKFALDSEYEEEQTPRYRPDSLASLCRATRFTEAELKRIYRGFKAECPTGVVREETFKCIYSQFFPQGANTSQYAHYVFNTLDQDHSGLLSFEDFVTGLSILSRGSMDEKLRWTFSLYDINGDGCITREEMTDIVTAVYELMGKFADPTLDHEGVRDKVDRMFQKMDGNKDGVVTLSEFLDACRADPDISASMAALDTAF